MLQRLADPPVGPSSAGGPQFFVQGVLDEGVGEGVLPRAPPPFTYQGRGRRHVE